MKHTESGLTLLEVVLAVAILSCVFLAFTNLFTTSFSFSVQAGRTTQAAFLAQEKMEYLRANPYAEMMALDAGRYGEYLSCQNGEPPVSSLAPGFENFQRSCNIVPYMLLFDGYAVKGWRLEVIIRQGDKETVKIFSFLGEE